MHLTLAKQITQAPLLLLTLFSKTVSDSAEKSLAKPNSVFTQFTWGWAACLKILLFIKIWKGYPAFDKYFRANYKQALTKLLNIETSCRIKKRSSLGFTGFPAHRLLPVSNSESQRKNHCHDCFFPYWWNVCQSVSPSLLQKPLTYTNLRW